MYLRDDVLLTKEEVVIPENPLSVYESKEFSSVLPSRVILPQL
jgi:hypothetical protein